MAQFSSASTARSADRQGHPERRPIAPTGREDALSATFIAQTGGDFAAARVHPFSGRLQRKCACGATTGGGDCDECRRKRIQTKLAIGGHDDPLEREADRIADRVLSTAPGAEPSSAPVRVQRQAVDAAGIGEAAPPSVERTLASSGQPLATSVRRDMEQRFGHDFGKVRVHADEEAQQSARDVSAQAYTVGSHIAFAAGRYRPDTRDGRRLLAHELTHVLQQRDGTVLRAPDAKTLAEFDEQAKKIKAHPVYKKQAHGQKGLVGEILAILRKRDDALAQLAKLQSLFDTPEGSKDVQTETVKTEIYTATQANTTRLDPKSKTKAPSHVGDEEAISAEKSRKFSKRRGRDGSLFQIDARDVSNIALIVQVHLSAKKKTKDNLDAIKNIENLQDAIEKRIATWGYSLDLRFVQKGGPDVFTINVDTGAWADAGNIAGGDTTFAHELHHLLGLEEDRYDYTNHATNAAMPVATRIYWFRREFTKKVGNNPESMMDSGAKQPLDDDVCMVAGKKTKAEIDACVKERSDARNRIIDPAIAKAASWANKAKQRVASDAFLTTGFGPAKVAEGMFQSKFPIGTARARLAAVDKTMANLTSNDIRLVSALIDVCVEDAPLTASPVLPFELCPQFFKMTLTDQSRGLLRGAFHLAGVGGAGKDQDCTGASCVKPCGGPDNADQWARFTQCFAEL